MGRAPPAAVEATYPRGIRPLRDGPCTKSLAKGGENATDTDEMELRNQNPLSKVEDTQNAGTGLVQFSTSDLKKRSGTPKVPQTWYVELVYLAQHALGQVTS
ncbi:hypothetical protein BTVI_63611 [Pitangus sulphuratus]|nr:hypothetical protein BTVI_63611 [Pitangus sulphuratus]